MRVVGIYSAIRFVLEVLRPDCNLHGQEGKGGAGVEPATDGVSIKCRGLQIPHLSVQSSALLISP